MSQGAQAGGVTIGGYRLAGLIGKGAIGEVHAAVHLSSAEAVALKLIALPHGGGGGPDQAETRRRFLAEAATAQQLHHPDIVRVLDAGEEGGTGWIAMELLHGSDLLRYTRPARLLPEAVVLRVGERVARALAHAHAAGVVHRDVKPANVIVDWAQDRITLTDFGIARLADADRTRTGLVLGSPAYMAPELLAGGQASASSDLYALGVTLFQMLAGRLPFDDTSMGALLRQVAAQAAPALHTLRPGLPGAVSDTVAALLAKHPTQRPASALALAQRLLQLRQMLDALPSAAGGGEKSRH